jgi:hypothetical protein
MRIYLVLYQSKIIRKIKAEINISIGPFTIADFIPDKYYAVSYINSKTAGAHRTNKVILKTLRILNSFSIYPTYLFSGNLPFRMIGFDHKKMAIIAIENVNMINP